MQRVEPAVVGVFCVGSVKKFGKIGTSDRIKFKINIIII